MFFDLKSHSNSMAIRENDKTLTYGELFVNNLKLGKLIQGSRLILVFPSLSTEYVSIYTTALNLGIPLILADEKLADEKKHQIIKTYAPDSVISSSSIAGLESYEIENNFGQFKIYKNKIKSNLRLNPSIQLLLPTSGSTGSTKYVKLSKRNLIANSDSIIKALEMDFSHNAMLSMPLTYSYGISILNTHLLVGGSVSLNNHFVLTREYWSLFQKYQANSLSGVPYFYQNLLKVPLDWFSGLQIKLMTQAGGKLPVEDVLKVLELNRKINSEFCVMYGQTEACARMTINRMKELIGSPKSVGKAIPGTHIKILNNGLESDEPNLEGEIIFYGDNVSLGISSGISDLAEEDTNKGKLITGDIGYLDNNKNLYITGRAKRFVKFNGSRLSLDDIEDQFKKYVGEVVLIEQNDKIICFHTTVINAEDKERIRKILGQVVAIFTYRQVPEFPRLENGKIAYSRLAGISDV
jgi:long-chain acyl-CoA synthetase